jgi:hypothetical protein
MIFARPEPEAATQVRSGHRIPGWMARTLAVAGFPASVAAASTVLQVPGADAWWPQLYLGATVLYGALVAQWWAIGMPTLWGTAFLITLRLVDDQTGGCSVCGSDEDWSNYPYFFFVIAIVPWTAAVAVGVGVRRAIRLAMTRRSRS